MLMITMMVMTTLDVDDAVDEFNLRQERSCHQVSSTQTCGVRTSARVRTKGQKISWNEYHWMGGKASRHHAKFYLNLHKLILLVSRSSPSPASPDTQLCSSTTQSSFPQVEIILFNVLTIIIAIVFARWSRMKRNNRSGVVSCAATWPPGSTMGSHPVRLARPSSRGPSKVTLRLRWWWQQLIWGWLRIIASGNIEYTCPVSNSCEINKRRRKACQACRSSSFSKNSLVHQNTVCGLFWVP